MSDLEAQDLGLLPPPSGLSPKEALRERVRQEVRERTLDLPIPGERWNGTLVARYRTLTAMVDGKLIGERVTRQFSDEAKRTYYGAIDTLIAACLAFYYRDPESGTLTLLDSGSGALGYTVALADYLGLTFDGEVSARRIVERLFDYDEIPLLAHVSELNEWMKHPTSAVTLGEA